MWLSRLRLMVDLGHVMSLTGGQQKTNAVDTLIFIGLYSWRCNASALESLDAELCHRYPDGSYWNGSVIIQTP